jgi:hypothetical protein
MDHGTSQVNYDNKRKTPFYAIWIDGGKKKVNYDNRRKTPLYAICIDGGIFCLYPAPIGSYN